MSSPRRVAILGGGSAGFTAARTAHRGGAKVVLFMGPDGEHASLCVNEGCMPSKTLFHAVDEWTATRRRNGWAWGGVTAAAGALGTGARTPDVPLDVSGPLARAVARKDRYVARWRAYRRRALRELAAREGFHIVDAPAWFEAPGKVRSSGRTFQVDAVILATGSEPIWPPIEGLNAVREHVWTNVEILHNTEVPESLAVIGAGATGLEFSLRYRRLGAEVTILSALPVLGAYDPVFGERLTRAYERAGIRMLAGRALRRIAREANGRFTLWPDGDHGKPVVAARVLLAAGRAPALAGLRLERAGIQLHEGRLRVGDDGRVEGQEAVFAAGDAVGRRPVVHKAHIEAQIAAGNAVSGGVERYDRPADLEVVFSDPEFATAGMDEREVAASGRRTRAACKEGRLIGKLYLEGDRDGIGKMTADAETGEILGVQLLCEAASDLIHLPSFAIGRGLTVADLASAEFYHPTRMEIVSGLADQLCTALGQSPRARPAE